MKIESQVCSLGLAEKLKELGVKQESYFAWYLIPIKDNRGEVAETQLGRNTKPMRRHANDSCSAFTIAELGEMLPELYYSSDGTEYELQSLKMNKRWYVQYGNREEENIAFSEDDQSEADARAKMVVHLIKNKFIIV